MTRFRIALRCGRLVVVGLIAATLLAGCVSVGPRAVQAGRADYNTVLRDTTDEQLLANLVRLRYRDRPYFLEVTAVTTQFSFTPSLSATAAVGSPSIEQDALISGGVGYAETPTVSYAPLQGDDFARRLLTPVSLEALVLLSHSGWSAERLMRVCVQRVNGIPNAVTASGPTPDAAPQYQTFNRLARRLRELQLSDDVTIGFRAGDDGRPVVMFSERALASDAYRDLVETLALIPGRRQYSIAPALRRSDGDTIGIQTRSLNGILYYLSHAVEVPEPHRAEGLVNVTRDAGGGLFDWSRLTEGLLAIEVASKAPEAFAVRVPYRGHWFYIRDNDLGSKSTFSLLAQLFALQAGSSEGVRPVLTLPVGG